MSAGTTDKTVVTRRETTRNTLRLMAAGIASQAAAILLTPAVARTYAPEDVGALGIVLSLVGIVVTLSTARYEQAIIIERSIVRARALFKLCLVLCIATSIVVAIAERIIGGRTIARWLNTPAMADYTWFIAPLVLLSGIGYTATYAFNRQGQFNYSARYIATQGVVGNALKVAFGFLPGGLYYANVGGHIIGLLTVVRRLPLRHIRWSTLREQIRIVAAEHWRFPTFNLPHALISTIAGNMPLMILAFAYGGSEVGCFAMCMTIGYKPVGVFAQSVGMSLFHAASRNREAHVDYARPLRRFAMRTMAVVAAVSVALYVCMPQLTLLFFGDGWDDTCAIMRCLLPLFAMSAVSIPLNFVPSMLNQQGRAMLIETCSAVVRTAAIAYGSAAGDIAFATLLLALTHSAFFAGQVIWYFSLMRRDGVQ